MAKKQCRIGSIIFAKEYLTEQNDFFNRKIYYNEIKSYYIKATIHSKYMTKDLCIITEKNKKKKMSYTVGQCGIFFFDPEENIINMMKMVCPHAEYIKK